MRAGPPMSALRRIKARTVRLEAEAEAHEREWRRIVGWTKGEIVADDFYPDHLNGRELAVAEEARP